MAAGLIGLAVARRGGRRDCSAVDDRQVYAALASARSGDGLYPWTVR